ncbi:hypothetical protein [Parabacteroides sp. PF5-6]|uniref:hypothetical protein n=1 Tax=Parabacteroides sp. PF5-6 TaxID=1742403 RepID=UPI0024068286|nr:hypothetical protein [Parabacteroides sp. PF5-6]MDF9831572.1 hypothetical protein [Parabacteroides sp. PF5-6]
MQTDERSGNTFCWVYIVKESEAAIQIGYSPSLPRMLAGSRGKALLYYRQFPHPVDGVAHKLYLENLSAENITRFIGHYNACGTNLLEEFRYDLTTNK